MLNDNITKTLKENRELRDSLYFVYRWSGGGSHDINEPFYITLATQEFRLPPRKVVENLTVLKELELIDNNGQTIRLKEEAKKYISEFVKRGFGH